MHRPEIISNIRAFQENIRTRLKPFVPREVRLPARIRARVSSPLVAGAILLSSGVVLENQFQVASKIGTGITCVAAETVNWGHWGIHGPLQTGSDIVTGIGNWAKPNPYEPIFPKPTEQPADQ